VFIQFIYANDLCPLFVLVVQFFQCLGLWNFGGKKITHPNPPIAVLYGTWCFAPESLPYHQQNEVRFCQPKRCVSSLRMFPISGAPTFLAPLDGACRVSAPPSGETAVISSLVKRNTGFQSIPKCDPYRAIITQKMSEKKFFNLAFWFFSCSTCSDDPKEAIWNSSKMTDIFEFTDN